MMHMRRTTIYLSKANDKDLQVIKDYYEMSASQAIRYLIVMGAIDVRRKLTREIELDIEKRESMENEAIRE